VTAMLIPDTTDPLISKAYQQGIDVAYREELEQRERNRDHIAIGFAFSVILNVLAIIGYLIGRL
jgi:hypothetical protein